MGGNSTLAANAMAGAFSARGDMPLMLKTSFALLRRKSARSSHSNGGSAFNWPLEPSHLDNQLSEMSGTSHSVIG